jgi:hypothetical protein
MRLSLSPALLLAVLTPLLLAAAPPTTQSQSFLRFQDDHKGGGQLQSAIVTLKNDAGVRLDLIAAVHIADPAYFSGLNERFKNYDAVLYEMVKPKDAPPLTHEALAQSGSTISSIQRFLKNALKLDFQLDDIDYTPANFIHADLDAETFYRLQSERGESMLSLMLNAMLQNLNRPEDPNAPDPTIVDLIKIFTDPDGPRQAKLLLARQFNHIEETVSGLSGPNGSVILTERNKAALTALRTALGDGHKHIALFFGAAHMPDLEQHAIHDLHFRPVKVQWIAAWKLPAPPATRPASAIHAATAPTTQPLAQ